MDPASPLGSRGQWSRSGRRPRWSAAEVVSLVGNVMSDLRGWQRVDGGLLGMNDGVDHPVGVHAADRDKTDEEHHHGDEHLAAP